MTETKTTLSDLIKTHYSDLSNSAQERIQRTRPHLLNTWELSEEGYCFDRITADSLDEAIDEARETVDTSCYDTSSGTVYVDIYVHNPVTGERGSLTLTVEPSEPECADDNEHDWRSPHSVLGGLKENPGVWGNGGGVIIREVCLHCGTYKITDTWAQRRDTGEQGLTEVSYEDADETSTAWVERRKNGE